MGIRTTIRDFLAADGTLSGLLTGGVFDEPEITRQDTLDAFDSGGEIKPCALVKLDTEPQTGPFMERGAVSSRLSVVVFFYQLKGFDVIDAALDRTRVLLQRENLSVDGVWEVTWADDVLDQEDDALDCSMAMSRYSVMRLRG